jgi:putative membrane protein insertion efficiency factor
MTRSLRQAPVRGVIFAIELYRHTISPLRLPTCRFTPTCSQYAVEALSEYGLIRGGWLAAVRLVKCGPWHRGGWDPIPERRRAAHDRCGPAAENLDERAAPGDRRSRPALQAESETRV